MSEQDILDEATKLKNEASKLQKQVADNYRDIVIDLAKGGKDDEARELIAKLDWGGSIHYLDLIRLIRANSI